MLEAALVALRLAQYAGAAMLFGAPLFFLYALPRQGPASADRLPWSRRLLTAAAVLTLTAALGGLAAQTSVMAGSLAEGLKPASLSFVATGSGLGRAALVRAAAAASALACLMALPAGRPLWRMTAVLGGVVAGSLAWMGHGAATEGPGHLVHLVGDILHSLAAAVWIGALAVFLLLLRPASGDDPQRLQALHGALRGFSGIGSLLVAALVASGLVNSWFLVGPQRLEGLWTVPYGQLLSVKLALFALMLGLAAANRFRLTPALGAALQGGSPVAALARLRRSVAAETATALAILALVAWLGTLAPVSAT